jgi:PAS domain S-box-containing protein
MKGPARPLRLLLVEDSEDDAHLLLRELRRGGYEPVLERVSTLEGMERALEEASKKGRPWQIVISDYYMPRFEAPDALALLRRLGYDTPFVVVSGKIGEETAVAMLRAGAQDYVSKENLVRLCPAIERELREAEGRREHERAEKALRESEERYRVVAETASDAIVVIDEDSRILFINSAAEKIFGYARAEMVGQRLTMLMPERLREVHAASLERYLETGRRGLDWSSIQLPGLHASGEEIPLEISFGEFVGDGERFFTGFVRDITERKEAEKRLREAETRYRTLVEQIPAVTYIQEPLESSDPKAVTYMSPQFETMLGYPRKSEVLDEEHWLRTLHPEDRERVLAEEARTDETGEPFRVEYRVIAKDGRVVWVRDQATLVRDEEGRPLYWLGVQHDITDQKQAQQELKESEERYRTFIEQSTEGIWRFELEEPVSPDLPEGEQIEHFYRYAYLAECNDAMAAMYGYERAEEIVGARLEDFLPRSLPANVAYLEAFVRSGYSLTDVESHEVDLEGNAKYFLNNLTGIVEDGHLVRAWGTQRDVTERKRAEEERSRLAAIVESSHDAILGKTLNGTITSWNRAAERLYGYSEEEAVGQPVTMLVPSDRPEEVPEILRNVRRGEKVERLETVRVSKDGRHLDVSLTVSPIRNQEGEIVGASTIARDITERKRAEEALREAREAERNRIARDLHDDILQDIVYALQEIQIVQVISEDGGATGLEEATEALRRSVEGLRGAIFELRLRETLGRSFVASLEVLLDLNRRMARRSYELELVVEDAFPRVLSERAGRELVRIVQEALANVRRHAEARHARVRLWREGDLACVEVADDGRGFDAESPGVGVGQQSMRDRALELGGELEVESQLGRGTRVRFEAPVSRLTGG